MTKAELVAAMAEQAGLTKEQAKKALDAFTDSVTDSLKKVMMSAWWALAHSKRLSVQQVRPAIHAQAKQ